MRLCSSTFDFSGAIDLKELSKSKTPSGVEGVSFHRELHECAELDTRSERYCASGLASAVSVRNAEKRVGCGR